MNSLVSRAVASLALALVCVLLLSGAASTRSALKQPDKLVILSTTDVKGKTSPCG